MRVSQTDDNSQATNLEAHSSSTNAWYTDHKNKDSSWCIFFINYSETAIKEMKPSYKYCETKKVFYYVCNQNEADLESWVEILCTKSSLALSTVVIRGTQTTGCSTHLPGILRQSLISTCSVLVKCQLHLLLERKGIAGVWNLRMWHQNRTLAILVFVIPPVMRYYQNPGIFGGTVLYHVSAENLG